MSLRRVYPFLAGFAAGLLILSVTCLSGALFLRRSDQLGSLETKKAILHTASAAASLIDAELHKTFTTPAQETTSVYASAIANLEKLRSANPDLKYIYTCILRGDSVYFVLDPTPAGDRDGDGVDDKSHIMQPYPDASPACIAALRTGRAATNDKPYTDAWGTFISAYAPFFDKQGKLEGVVGADMELRRYLGEMAGMRKAAWAGFFIALALSSAAGAGVFFVVRFLRSIYAQRSRDLELLEQAKVKAEAATRAKGDFLTVMSHEIRTPMNGVLGMLDLLLASPLPQDRADLAQTAHASAKSLLALINDILDFSKIESGKFVLEAFPFDVVKLAAQSLELFRFEARGKGLGLSLRHEPDMRARVVGDAARLRRVVINLLGNALKFTESGHVTLTLRWAEMSPEGGVLEVEVEDTGIGIPAEKQGSLFRMFAQADASTTRQYGGTGLGLAISKDLVELMGGSIGVDSRPGRGSVFRFRVRMPWDFREPVPDPREREAVASGGPAREEGTYPARDGVRVLIAEDNAVNRKVAVMTLARLGLRADCVGNGEEAVAKASAYRYHMVLMDCLMPGMDGYAAAAAIRRLPEPFAQVPIIALTANAGSGDSEKCRIAGMDGYLAKPFQRNDLETLIHRWIPAGAADKGLPAAGRRTIIDPMVMTNLMGNRDVRSRRFVEELILDFHAIAESGVSAMEEAVARGDAEGLRATAHELKGAGATLGANDLAEHCLRLEACVGAGDFAKSSEVVTCIKRELIEVDMELAFFEGPAAAAAAGRGV